MYWLDHRLSSSFFYFILLSLLAQSSLADTSVQQTVADALSADKRVELTALGSKSKSLPYTEDNDGASKDDAPTKKAVVFKEQLDPFELPEVDVIATTPIGNTGLANKKVAGNVQSAEDEEVHRHESFAISDFMNRRLESVNINDVQNNPYQPDVTYRGFVASPLAGTPIGLSVYQDGVRVNEPFGDTVNWDLIPQIAIANMELVPGSNPLYGLNTLGGAISVRTKSGSTHQGFHAQSYGGSYGRQNYQAEYGGAEGGFDWYMAGTLFRDNGWRPNSPTSVNQVFGKWGWNDEKTDLDFSFTYANNNMQGVGPTPQSEIYQNYYAAYTAPDVITNLLYFGTLKGTHEFNDKLKIGGNAYYRSNTSSNLNSNANDACDKGYQGDPNNCTEEDGTVTTPGLLVSSNLIQNGLGINLQLTSDYELFGLENQLVTGGGFNYGHTNYWQGQNNAVFSPLPYMVGVTPYTTNVMVSGSNAYTNLFATDTLSPLSWLHLTSSLNWMQAQINNYDNQAYAADYAGQTLNSSNLYSRVNPSAGFTLNPLDALEIDNPLKDFTTYFNYNEGFRAPTAMELGCADPAAPCSLPNEMVSDPPLQAVITKTLEIGARSQITKDMKWNAAIYQSRSYNDIQFLPSGNANGSQGYFSNVGITQRMGAEFGLSGMILERLNWYTSYGFVNATYQTNMTLQSPVGEMAVTPGNHIPSIPQNTIKFGSEYEFIQGLFIGGDLQYVGPQYARGDYANQYGQMPSYTVLNLNAKYFVTKEIELFAMGRNVTSQQYYSYGQIGHNFFNQNNQTTFLGPGAPATAYAGIRIHWE